MASKVTYVNAADALENDLDIAGSLPLRRNDRDQRPNVMEVFRPWIVGVGIPMGRDDHVSIGGQGVIDRAHRTGAPDQQGDYIPWKNDNILQGQEWMPLMEPIVRIHHTHAGVLRMRESPSRGRVAYAERAIVAGLPRRLQFAGT